MTRDNSPDVVTGRRTKKLRDRARRAQRNGRSACVLTLYDHQNGPISVLLVGEPGQAGPAYAYFPQATEAETA